MYKVIRWASIGTIIATLGLITAGSISSQEVFPDGPGRDTLFLACVQCHPPDRVTNAQLTADDWEFIVYDMIVRGAPVYEEDIDDLNKYLIDNFAIEK
jgi:hypothetical protein